MDDGFRSFIIAADGAPNIWVMGGPVSSLQKVLTRVSIWQMSGNQVAAAYNIWIIKSLFSSPLHSIPFATDSSAWGLQICPNFSLEAWAVSQAFLEKAIGWTCGQDCSYSCMWLTVEVYGQHGRFFNMMMEIGWCILLLFGL